jgi:hypothetical protein
MHKTRYQQLQPEDRVSIASLRQQGFGVRAISKSTTRSRYPNRLKSEAIDGGCAGSLPVPPPEPWPYALAASVAGSGHEPPVATRGFQGHLR